VAGATVVASNGETVTCRSDAAGRFALQGLGDLPVHCFATAPGHGLAIRRGVPAGSTDVEFQLPGTATVSGQLEIRPLPERFNVRLSLFEPDLAQYFPLYAKDFEGVAGADFHFTDVSPGQYRLEVQADGFETRDFPEVRVVSGQSLSGLQVRLGRKP
jgi:hypothetical protein